MIKEQRSILDDDKRDAKLQEINTYILENVLTPFDGRSMYSSADGDPAAVAAQPVPAPGVQPRSFMVDVWLDKDAPTRK